MLIPEISTFFFRTDSTIAKGTVQCLEHAVMNSLDQNRSIPLLHDL
jgi:hypothetical protein